MASSGVSEDCFSGLIYTHVFVLFFYNIAFFSIWFGLSSWWSLKTQIFRNLVFVPFVLTWYFVCVTSPSKQQLINAWQNQLLVRICLQNPSTSVLKKNAQLLSHYTENQRRQMALSCVVLTLWFTVIFRSAIVVVAPFALFLRPLIGHCVLNIWHSLNSLHLWLDADKITAVAK